MTPAKKTLVLRDHTHQVGGKSPALRNSRFVFRLPQTGGPVDHSNQFLVQFWPSWPVLAVLASVILASNPSMRRLDYSFLLVLCVKPDSSPAPLAPRT